MRPETTLILSSIDSRTLAEFPPELDPCVNEALRNEAIIEAVKGVWKPLAAGGGVLGDVQLAYIPWECETREAGYTCVSPSPATVTLKKRPGCGSVRASKEISVPRAGGKIEFIYDVRVSSWTNPIYIKIDGDIVLKFAGRSYSDEWRKGGSGTHEIADMSKYAGRVVTFEVVSEDHHMRWCGMSDHNFDVIIKDLTFTGVTLPEPERLFITAGDVRDADVNTREAVARAIQRVTIPEAVALTTPTAIQGVVIPKLGTGLPQMPVVIPLLALQGVEIKPEGVNMIEFQEIIPGIKPPSIPSLIPGLEKLPLLPGWTIRDPNGKILNEGVRMPLVPPIGATGIAIPPELPIEGEIAPPTAADSELHPDAVTLEKLLRDPIASEEEIADVAVELGLELDEDGSSLDEEVEL